ncbi:uncharacterized protein LOC127851383 [Dreissena polymorpha]|uniref:Uncharacterized protein n=1 Tax=Dreissena polymorpha TaxID=45954 RepID=A0A9D4CYI6_DREPO|nr:uncharacterized protein LOC127851383 [Dreissena polymorpha]KAH3735853.1 hypothetical protein DPMN_042411 [Dreissena polymorpha]
MAYNSEIRKLQTKLRRLDSRIEELKQTIEKLNKEIEEAAEICDERDFNIVFHQMGESLGLIVGGLMMATGGLPTLAVLFTGIGAVLSVGNASRCYYKWQEYMCTKEVKNYSTELIECRRKRKKVQQTLNAKLN